MGGGTIDEVFKSNEKLTYVIIALRLLLWPLGFLKAVFRYIEVKNK